jgi:hypothetical protein
MSDPVKWAEGRRPERPGRRPGRERWRDRRQATSDVEPRQLPMPGLAHDPEQWAEDVTAEGDALPQGEEGEPRGRF